MSFILRVSKNVWSCVGFNAPAFYQALQVYVRDAINWRARILLPAPQFVEPIIAVSHRRDFVDFVFYFSNWDHFITEDQESFRRAVCLFVSGQLWHIVKEQVGAGCLAIKPWVFNSVRIL